MIYKKLRRKLKIDQQKPRKKDINDMPIIYPLKIKYYSFQQYLHMKYISLS
jgi:hypothetical protein